MKEHPLLMQGPLVRATLEGRKTQTRRPIKPQPDDDIVDVEYDAIADLWLGNTQEDNDLGYTSSWAMRCPLGQAGDRLWVRETWRPVMETWRSFVEYGAGGELSATGHADAMTKLTKVALRFPGGREDIHSEQWHPSIHMPRWACRLVLPLVSVRVERVQDITEEDARAEGVPHNGDRPIDKSWCAACCGHGIVERFALGMVSVDDCSECNSAKKLFRNIWISIYGQESWDANPWVWVAEWEDIEVSR